MDIFKNDVMVGKGVSKSQKSKNSKNSAKSKNSTSLFISKNINIINIRAMSFLTFKVRVAFTKTLILLSFNLKCHI